jgi:hypothetical protein
LPNRRKFAQSGHPEAVRIFCHSIHALQAQAAAAAEALALHEGNVSKKSTRSKKMKESFRHSYKVYKLKIT